MEAGGIEQPHKTQGKPHVAKSAAHKAAQCDTLPKDHAGRFGQAASLIDQARIEVESLIDSSAGKTFECETLAQILAELRYARSAIYQLGQ